MGVIFRLQLTFETTPAMRNEFSFVPVSNAQTALTAEEILPLFYALISSPENASKSKVCEEVI